MKDAPGQGTKEGLAAGIYWGVILMLSVLGAMVLGVVLLMRRFSHTATVPPPPTPASPMP